MPWKKEVSGKYLENFLYLWLRFKGKGSLKKKKLLLEQWHPVGGG